MILPILADMLLVLVPTQRLPHIQRILAIVVIVQHAPIDRIPHFRVQLLGDLVAGAHKQVHEPGLGGIGLLLQDLGEPRGVAEAPRGRRNGERRDVAVPGEVVGVWVGVWVVGGDGGWEGRGLEFAEDCVACR